MSDELITFNVGGRKFQATRLTMCCRGGVLQVLFAKDSAWPNARMLIDSKGRPFIDCDPDVFVGIMTFLRTGHAIVPPNVSVYVLDQMLDQFFPGKGKPRAITPKALHFMQQHWYNRLDEWAHLLETKRAEDCATLVPPFYKCTRLDGLMIIYMGCTKCDCATQITLASMYAYYGQCTAEDKLCIASHLATLFAAEIVHIDPDAQTFRIMYSR